jgi:hypothetical protein
MKSLCEFLTNRYIGCKREIENENIYRECGDYFKLVKACIYYFENNDN